MRKSALSKTRHQKTLKNKDFAILVHLADISEIRFLCYDDKFHLENIEFQVFYCNV